MCIILDVNCFTHFKDQKNEDMKPVRDWLAKENSKIVYAPTDKFKEEWKGTDNKLQLKAWSQAGKLREADKQEVEEEATKLKGKLKSNDEHIIALAKIAEVNVLVSYDKKLHEDFKGIGGKIYQEKSHKHLLKPDMCP